MQTHTEPIFCKAFKTPCGIHPCPAANVARKAGFVAGSSATPGSKEPLIIRTLQYADRARAQRDASADERDDHKARASMRPEAMIAGIIANPRSRHNVDGLRHEYCPSQHYASPLSQADLRTALRQFADDGVNFIVIDGGDGTVRDVLTMAGQVFEQMPRLAVVPSGKTNALAVDLGIPPGWTARQAIAAAEADRFKSRSPIEVIRGGSDVPELRGFIFGAGRFVDATKLANRVHRARAFNGVAVALSLSWSVLQTLFGGTNNIWRQGERVQLRSDGGAGAEQSLYLLLASTLERMPLGLKPFGQVRRGLKVLSIDGPPRRLVATLLPMLVGSDRPWLRELGYQRWDVSRLDIALQGGFVVDGELYEGGEITVRRGTPVLFAVP